MIRVVLVDDSPVALKILQDIVEADGDIVVAGSAADGLIGWQKIREIRPDVVCTDYHMPNMNGLALVQAVMSQHPLPILVISVSVAEEADNELVMSVLQAGALDILAKPPGGPSSRNERWGRQLRQKIRVLSGSQPMKLIQYSPYTGLKMEEPPGKKSPSGGVIVIGASTGGPQALTRILKALPEDFSCPVVVVQHIGASFLPGLVTWLGKGIALPVIHARAGDRLRPGTIYFPPATANLSVTEAGQFFFHPHDPGQDGVNLFSIDLTCTSLAHCFQASVLGILLTGMGSDGARGLLEIRRRGGATIAQDEASSVIFGMPRQAIELGAARAVLPLNDMAGAMLSWCRTGRIPC
ncbi:MAG: chemotaxis-specific protein-glutamate methyltransferase CheB [Magnetococcales bacterium]|nr:chemotaxis-specific protein-glutamate methyltransferase CheB [Magnetococcales bacterium]